MMSPRGSPATRSRLDREQGIRLPRWETTGWGVAEQPIEEAGPSPPTGSGRFPQLRIFESKSRRSREAHIGRARRLLAADLTYIVHPSFDDPSADDASLTSVPGLETPGRDRAAVPLGSGTDASHGKGIPSREQEAHMFREMNYLKYLACRIRDRIDPDSPDLRDLDEVERLQAEALKLKNQIVETHLRLVVSVAKKHVRAGYDLAERISDGNFALMRAVDRFDFARGNRFSTYATWAVFNELVQCDRRERRRRYRSIAPYQDSLAAPDSVSDQYQTDEAQDERGAAVKRLLRRLDRRERRIIVNRNGIGGGPERTLSQIGLDLGISKERVRQLEQRALAKLRSFAHREGIAPSDF
jgi:RNA polymerase primary sigma factor